MWTMYKASRICSRVFTATIRKRHLTTVQQRFNTAHKYRSLEESTEKQLFLKNPERMDRFVLRQLLKDWLWFFRSLASDEKEFRPKIAYNAELLARKILTEKELGNQGPDCPEELCSTIRILSKIDEPKKAENLLQMLEDTNAVNLLSLLQKELAYSSVIQAWSQKGDNFSFHRALHWFQKIENPPLQAYNSILNAYANRGKAHEAGNLFLQMQKSENVMPSSISYCIVMKAWVRSNRRDAQEMVENLLEELKFAYISQGCPPSLLPNGVVYGVAMSLASAKRATSLLQELCDSYQLIKIPELTPTILHYMIAMKAWAKDGKPHEAERLLMEMKNAYESGNDTLRPEYQCYVIVIDAFAKQFTKQGARAAEKVLMMMEQYYLKRHMGNNINNYGYNAVMDSYARASNNSTDAERIFKHMKDLAKMHNLPQVLPDKISLTTLMKAWMHGKQPCHGEKVEELLQEMEDEIYGEDKKPDIITYGVALDVLSKCGEKNVALRQLAIIQRMHQNGIKPNRICYNSILQTYAKDGDYQSAINLLKEMQELSQNGNESVKPNGVDYSTGISALASNSRTDISILDLAYSLFFVAKECYNHDEKKLSASEMILTNMLRVLAKCNVGNKARHIRDIIRHGEEMELVFNLINYNVLLRALASECGDLEAKQEAYQMAEQSFFSRMAGSTKNYDSQTFLNFLLCCQNLLQENNQKREILEKTFEMCCKSGLVSEKVLNLFYHLVPNSYMLRDIIKQGNALDINRVPIEWKLHVKK